MNKCLEFTLKGIRKAYSVLFTHDISSVPLPTERLINETSSLIYSLLESSNPCMIARFGSTELMCYANYDGVKKGRNICDFITGKQDCWWWQDGVAEQMQKWSGFFPPTYENLDRYCKLLEEDSKLLDLLGSWVTDEKLLEHNYQKAKITPLICLEPYLAEEPWSKALGGKNVLVVHPFAEQIAFQYSYFRKMLFDNRDVLPDFNLTTIKAVQSLGGDSNGFKDWFEALDWMKSAIDKCEYDVCLIGCGAYGFNLAAHVKRQGKKAIHLGGALQLLFGIKGKRWEDPLYGVKEWRIPEGTYLKLMNENWRRPRKEDRSVNASEVENGCYW